MGILFGFLSFVAFAILNGPFGSVTALLAGAAASAFFIFQTWRAGRSLKILEAGTFILFTATAIYLLFAVETMSGSAIRLAVDAGLLLIVVVSTAVKRPFTLQYARTRCLWLWGSPRFLRANYIISGAWAADVNGQLEAVQSDLSCGKGRVGGESQSVCTVEAIDSIDQLSAPPPKGSLVRLDELGTVTDSRSDISSFACLNGKRVIATQIKRSKGYSDIAVTGNVREAMKIFAAASPRLTIHGYCRDRRIDHGNCSLSAI